MYPLNTFNYKLQAQKLCDFTNKLQHDASPSAMLFHNSYSLGWKLETNMMTQLSSIE